MKILFYQRNFVFNAVKCHLLKAVLWCFLEAIIHLFIFFKEIEFYKTVNHKVVCKFLK